MGSQGLGYYTDTAFKRPGTRQSVEKDTPNKDESTNARSAVQKNVHKSARSSRSGSRSHSRGRRRSRSRSRGRRRRHKNDRHRKKTKKPRSTSSSESPIERDKAADDTNSKQDQVKQVTLAEVDTSKFDLNANSIAERVAELEQSLCKAMAKEKSTSMATSWIMECFSEQVLTLFLALHESGHCC